MIPSRPRAALATLVLFLAPAAIGAPCTGAGLRVQVLTVAGEPPYGWSAASYLVWRDAHPIVLINAGPGSARRLQDAGADPSALAAIVLNSLHLERTGDLSVIVARIAAGPRTAKLPIFGPAGGRTMPSTVTFVRTLFDATRGAYRHLGDVLSPLGAGRFKLDPHDLRLRRLRLPKVGERDSPLIDAGLYDGLRLQAAPSGDPKIPTLAWRIEDGKKAIAVGGAQGLRGEDGAALTAEVAAWFVSGPLSGEHEGSAQAPLEVMKRNGVKRLIVARHAAEAAPPEEPAGGERVMRAEALACVAID